MKTALITLGCALALAGAPALAQQHRGSGESLTEKAKEAAHVLAEKTREAAAAVKEKAKAADDRRADEPEHGDDAAQKRADAELKAARAKCDAVTHAGRRTVCQKEAQAAHAQAEVRIAKANLAADKSAGAEARNQHAKR